MGIQIQSEGRSRITKAAIEGAWKRRTAGKRLILRDADTAGLALIVNPETMTWVFSYRPRGSDPASGRRWPNKTVTLGNPSSLSIDDARHAAAALKGQAAAGADPHALKKARLAKAQEDRAATASRVLDAYEKALPSRPKLRGSGLPTPKHVAEEIAQARSALRAMEAENVALRKIDSGHLRRLLALDGERPATARARFGALSRFMDWAQDEGMATANPCAAISRSRRPRSAPARAHYLEPVQLAALWKAADQLDPLYRDVARFLIALPCRRGEAINLDWSHLDLPGASWAQPGKMTKNGEPHRLHLHPLALDILNARYEAADKPKAGLVFPAPRSKKAIDTFTVMKADLENKSGITGWRWHDFRRSFASVLGELGLPEPVLDACLNHRQSATRGGVLGVYQRAQRWPEQVSAMKAWGAALHAAIEGRASESNIVAIKAAP